MDAFIHHTSKMAREHLLLKFGKRPNIMIGSKLQRFELNNSERLEVDPMQVCLPKFREAQSSDSKREEMTLFCVPTLTPSIGLKYP